MKKYVIPAAGAAVAVTALVVFVALRPGAEAPEGTPVEAPPEPAPVAEDEEPDVTDEDADADSDRSLRAGPTVKAIPESEIRGARKPKDAKLSAFVDPQAKGTRIPGDITSRIPRIEQREDVPLVVSVMKDRKDSDTVRHEAVNLLRRSGYPELTRDLIRVLDDPHEKPRFRAFCTQHLWCNYEKARPEEQAVIEAKLRELLRDDERAVRREALLALVRLRDPLGEKAAVEWLHDDERTKVRDLAIRCVRELGL